MERHGLDSRVFYGLAAAVIAIVVSAVKRIGSKALKTPSLWMLAATAFVAIFFLKISFVIIILGAAVVGVILNLAIWFALHALRPVGGGFDIFIAVAAVVSLVAMERFKVGVVPTLVACALAGMIWKLV